MKEKKLALLGLAAAILGITLFLNTPSAHADTATDQKAAGIISKCKVALAPYLDPDCQLWNNCKSNILGIPNNSSNALCQAISRLNDQVPGENESPAKTSCDKVAVGAAQDRCKTLKSCTDAGKSINACMAGYAQCLVTNPNKAADCVKLIAQGNVDDASKQIPDPPSGKKTTCQIDGIGWIVCPVMNFLSKIVDGAYSIVAALLNVQPLLTTGQTKSIYDAWSYMRTFANVAFVIAFLIIIFSQVSSVGITNYGIKKMLPRLIVAAILVNVSYWICAIVIDASNILGSSLTDLFTSLKAQLAVPSSGISAGATGDGWVGITGGLLAGAAATGAALYVGLSALLPILITVLFAIIATLIILALRQAFIILLVIVSPLAFVAYLLPNTEQLFKQWRKLLEVLLLLYPTIALIFGASALASQVVMNSATGGEGVKLAIQIMGAGIAVVPLLITPIVMKGAAGAMHIAGFVNNPNKGPFDRMRKGAASYRENRQNLRNTRALGDEKYRIGQSLVRRKARKEAINNSRAASLKYATTDYVSDQATQNGGDNKFASRMAGGTPFSQPDEKVQASVVASAVAQQKRAVQEDVSNMEALIKLRFSDPGEALEDAIGKGDSVQAMAAQNLLIKSGGSGVSKFRQIVEESESDPGMQAGLSQVTSDLKTNIKDNHGQYVKGKGADITAWAGSDNPSLANSSAGQLSDNDLAGQHSGSIEKMVDQGAVGGDQARRMLNDPRVSANLDEKQKAQLTRAAGGDVRPNPTPAQLNQAHEEAEVQNRLHDMDHRDGS